MNAETINQAYLFLVFALNGILIGVIFDIFRILRRSFNTPNIITNIEDVLFWIISAIIVMSSIFIFNNGQFRGYIFIGILFGILIYMLFFSKIIVGISVKIILFIKNIILWIFRPVIKIFTNFANIIAKFVKKLYNTKKKGKKQEILQNKEGI